MTNKEILEKAIEKARNNGFMPNGFTSSIMAEYFGVTKYSSMLRPQLIPFIIFSHDFAKAFWGEGKIRNIEPIRDASGKITARAKGFYVEQGWQYHLQQLVLYEDPLEYIAKFI